MKKTNQKLLSLLCAAAMLISWQGRIVASELTPELVSELASGEPIKIGEYSSFLNEYGSDGDCLGLYDKASMGEEIVATKVEDHIEYQPSAGVEQEALMKGLNPKQEEAFACWKKGKKAEKASPLMFWGKGKLSEKSSEQSKEQSNRSKSERERFGLLENQDLTKPESDLNSTQSHERLPLQEKVQVQERLQPVASHFSLPDSLHQPGLLGQLDQLGQLQFPFKTSWLNSFLYPLRSVAHLAQRGRSRGMKIALPIPRPGLPVTFSSSSKTWTTFENQNNSHSG